jgi:hypothetical protein
MGRFLRKIFAIPIKMTLSIPNSMKGYSSSGRGSILMPSTTGVAKSGSELEPHGTANKKSGSVLEPHSKKE